MAAKKKASALKPATPNKEEGDNGRKTRSAPFALFYTQASQDDLDLLIKMDGARQGILIPVEYDNAADCRKSAIQDAERWPEGTFEVVQVKSEEPTQVGIKKIEKRTVL